MPQVVDSKVRATGRDPSLEPVPSEGVGVDLDLRVAHRRKEQCFATRGDMLLEMLLQDRQQMRWDRNVPHPRSSLRLAYADLAVDAHHAPDDVDGAHLQVEVLSSELGHLAEPEPAPSADQDQGAVGRWDLLKNQFQLTQRGRLDRPSTLGRASTANSAGIGRNDFVRHSRREDRAQQAVRVGLGSADSRPSRCARSSPLVA